MPKLAFSTLACPSWKIDHIARSAAACGYQGIELRTAGYGCSEVVSDPAQTSVSKTLDAVRARGVGILSLATGLSFDAPINPPIIGSVIVDQERTVRQAKRMIDLASSLECPLVRVFAFKRWGGESHTKAARRICNRLSKVVDHADKTGVRIAIENGGDFLTASLLMHVLDAIKSPLLCASYSPAIALRGGEDPTAGVATLGDRLALLKVREVDEESSVMPDVSTGSWNTAIRSLPDNAWIVVEHDTTHYHTTEDDIEPVLAQAAQSVRAAIGSTAAISA